MTVLISTEGRHCGINTGDGCIKFELWVFFLGSTKMNPQSSSKELACSREHFSFENCMKLKLFESKCAIEKYQFVQCITKETPFVAIRASFSKKIETLPVGKTEHQLSQQTQ